MQKNPKKRILIHFIRKYLIFKKNFPNAKGRNSNILEDI